MSFLDILLSQQSKSIIFQCIAGSRAYGTAHQNSDEDIRGIFILPSAAYLSVIEPKNMISDERGDIVYYSLHRFIQLASTSNPNIIELLYMPNDCIQLMTPWMETLVNARQLFITKQAYASHIGYAQAQIKKARGQNKWINNPQPSVQPTKEEYCWVIMKTFHLDLLL